MKHYKIIIFSIILISCILGPDFFTKSGLFLFLDTVFYPVYHLGNFFSKSLFWHFRDIGILMVGYALFSKIFLFLVLLLGSFLGYKIAKYITSLFQISQEKHRLLVFSFSIVFALSNPFIYERLVTQTGIALGIFCIGIAFVYLLEFLESRKEKLLYLSATFFGFSFTTFPHSSLFILLIGIITFVFFWKKFSLKNILFSLGIFFGLNFNWLIGNFFLGTVQHEVHTTISTFNWKNIEAFMQGSLSGLGVELTSLFGYGFWGERSGHLITPDLLSPYWFIFATIVFFFIVYGGYIFWQKDKKKTLYFLVIYFVFFILALGISSPVFSWFNGFLYENIPYYIGMREPGKFLGMLAILNTLFFVIGIYSFSLHLKKYFNIEQVCGKFMLFFLVIFLLIQAYNPAMLWGFKGQLHFIHYPEEYFQAKKYLEQRKEFRNLILPWHSYMSCDWKDGKAFANTFPRILNFPQTIESDNIEAGEVYSNYNSQISEQVGEFGKTKDITILRKLGVQNIIYQDHCADTENYEFLDELDGLKKVFDQKYLKIYKIEKNEQK